MKNFKPGDRSRDRRSYGGRDSGRSLMHDAVCDECGKDCQVPFRPSSGKPVYCSNCFEEKGGRDSNRSGRGVSQRRSYGDRGSGRSSQRSDRGSSQFTEKIEVLNTKLDKIINLLSPADKKKSKLVKAKLKKNKKSKIIKKDEVIDVLKLVEKKDTDLTKKKAQKKY